MNTFHIIFVYLQEFCQMSQFYAPFGDLSELVYVIFFRLAGADILWILIYLSDPHISHVFMVHTKCSIFVSDVVILHIHWLVSTSKVITLCIWHAKMEFLQTLFHLNFSICSYKLIMFFQPTYICKQILFPVMQIFLYHSGHLCQVNLYHEINLWNVMKFGIKISNQHTI